MQDGDDGLRGTGELTWASPAWLEANLGKATVLDAQPDVHDYLEEHLPGAVRVEEGALRAPVGGLPTAFAPPAAVSAVLRAAGVRAGAPVAVYTSVGARSARGDGLGATYLAHALVRHGCRRVHVLDGGLERWKAEGRRVTKDIPNPRASRFQARVRRDLLVARAQVESLRERPGVLLLDTRSAQSYEGQSYLPRPGHIEGAVSLPWTSFVTEANRSRLRPLDEIAGAARAAGVMDAREVIVSCGTGRTASLVFPVLRGLLGRPRVRFYEGSLADWTREPGARMVAGSSPR